ncbi:diacylglycerol kinase [Streptomyces triculaminicus]|uniref:Diacylglycerol kinase n=1 Tax=Streptomyces triculaminicus TaxID=2816232 RepID=A0A939FSC0_9ACTN|nr:MULTISPECIES: diacylglycerol kinase family protein [Streptomyces]MBO0655954.1 diacylglycerol kinase [Streptomyces triculaminicus]
MRQVAAPGGARQRWSARVAVVAAVGAGVLLLSVAGFKSVALVAVGAAGLAVTAAAGWWALTRRGVARGAALVLAGAAPLAVLAAYVAARLLWIVVVSLALWALAAVTGRSALRADSAPRTAPGRPVPPPGRAFLLMNPRSGGGKVGRFRLKERAEALGAEVVLLGPGNWDAAGLARDAVARGADLLGVAGGDGTQALVADVAAEHDVPFVVIPAGTRNHFALDLGLDRDDPSRSLEALTDGVEFRVDLGRVGGRVFVNNASFGAYAEVVQSPAYRDDKAGTLLRLLPDVLTHQHGPRLTVGAGAVALDAPQAVLVSNNPYRVGDRAGLGRRDRLDGGVLGLVGVTVDSAVQAADLLRGRRAPGLVSLTAGEVVVDADGPEVRVGVDGEALTLPTPVRCVSEPGALRIRVPRHRPGVPPARPRLDWRRLWELAARAGRALPAAGSSGAAGPSGSG